jgi:hypothetical protein
MKLSTWIESKGGNVKAAALLGVNRNCAYAWRRGVALPRAHIMKLIVAKTSGKVSYAEMVDEYLDLRAKKKTLVTTTKKKPMSTFEKARKKVDKAFTPKPGKKKKTVVDMRKGKKKVSVLDPGF